MDLFDKRYVYFMEDRNITGKKCFVADSIDRLIIAVNNNLDDYKGFVTNNSSKDSRYPLVAQPVSDYPLSVCKFYKFAYYDPNYECKIAYEKGKQIQVRISHDIWANISKEPDWCGCIDYRIKPEGKIMTHRQLAEWIAKGNGQFLSSGNVIQSNIPNYSTECDDRAVAKDDYPYCVKIRRWGSDEWVEPTEDIYYEDCGRKD